MSNRSKLGIIRLPRFVSPEWVSENVGNIQPSDIRLVSERCIGAIEGWPDGKLSREAFSIEVLRALSRSHGLDPLNQALKKRKLFDPIIERALQAVRQAGRMHQYKARIKSNAEIEAVTHLVAECVIALKQPEFLREFTFAAVLRGLLTVEGIDWSEQTDEWDELKDYLSRYRSSPDMSELGRADEFSAATDCGQDARSPDGDVARLEKDNLIERWVEQVGHLDALVKPELPNMQIAVAILEIGQAMVALAKQFEELPEEERNNVRIALVDLLDALPADGEAFDIAMLGSLLDDVDSALLSFEDADRATTIICRLAGLADAWKREHQTHQVAISGYLAAPITQRAQFDAPMRDSQSRLVDIKEQAEALTGELTTFFTPPYVAGDVEPVRLIPQADEDGGIETSPTLDAHEKQNEVEGDQVGHLDPESPEVVIDEPTSPLGDIPEEAEEARVTLRKLLVAGRHALASQVADALEVLFPSCVGEITPQMFKLNALTVAAQEVVDVPPGPLLNCCLSLRDNLGELNWNEGSADRAKLLYLLAGLLFPSLFIPASMARNALKQQLSGCFGSAAQLHRLVSHVSEIDRFGGVLTPEVLSKTDQQDFWEQRLALLQDTAGNWKDNKEIYHGFGNFRPAEYAWTAIMDPNRGAIGKVMRAFARHGVKALDQIQAAIPVLEQGDLEDLIEQSAGPKHSQRFEGRARSHLQHNREASVAFLERCVRHLLRAPDRSSKATNSGMEHFVVELRDRIAHAVRFVEQHTCETDAESAGCFVAHQALKRVELLFTRYDAPSLDMSLDRWFGRELLLLEGVRFSGGWTLDPSDERSLIESAGRFASDMPENLTIGLETVFDKHLMAEAHIQTGRILAELETLGTSKSELAIKQARRDEEIRDLRGELARLQSEARDRINMAIALNLIDDVEKRTLESRVRGIRVDSLPILDLRVEDIVQDQRGRGSIVADFPAARDTLQGVERQLDERFQAERARLTESVNALAEEGKARPIAVDRIRKLLDAKDIVTANEYLRLLRDGEDLPHDARTNAPLHDFMQRFLPLLEQSFTSNKQRLVDIALSVLRQEAQEVPGVFEIGTMTAAQRDDAIRMLEAWSDVRSARNLGAAIERLFVGGLSFDVKQIDDLKEKGGRLFRYYLSSARLIVPDGFLVPLFGSEADGNYLVEVLRGQIKTTELFQNMQAEAAKQRATFHLYAGLLGTADRTDLALRAHNRGYQGLVLDDGLIVYLAFGQQNKLATFFRIATAFIRYNPFNEITPLPPEMFYGRSEARDQIVSRRGGSLVFGGRRLGKSSLLRDVERKKHSPNDDVFVKCIDINDIGQTEGYGARFWQRLAIELRGSGVLLRQTSNSADEIVDDLQAFLSDRTSRQVLLMLDEVDNFLLAEEENRYLNVVRLRQLLEGTEGRFKVVMAGLHNVQRTATSPNQSLGHFGTPICIGPFVGDDRMEGLKLVTEPFAALGFEFQSPTLPLRILSQTNYYPALVQLYCRELLNHLIKTNRKEETGPPFTILGKDLEAAYKNQTLSEEINKRFRLTLDLDDRYKLITFIIANAAIEHAGFGAVPPPISPEEIGRQCLGWAPSLFESKTPSAFLALLEELVGLGVLSQQGREGFVLRSPNLVTMLGSKDSISEELINFENRDLLTRDRSTQRRILDSYRGTPSPLTPAQEHRLLEANASRVSVVLGSAAMGIGNVEKALQSIRQDGSIEVVRAKSADELLRRSAAKGRSPHQNKIVIVPDAVPWDATWVRRVLTSASDLEDRKLSIIFIGGPSQVRALVSQPGLGGEVDIETIEIWSEGTFRHYLSERERRDCDLPELRASLMDASGYSGEGVVHLLEVLQDRGENLDDATNHVKRELGRRADVLTNFGITGDLKKQIESVISWLPCSREDLSEVSEGPEASGPMTLVNLLQYAVWTGAIYQNGDVMHANPLVKQCLSDAS